MLLSIKWRQIQIGGQSKFCRNKTFSSIVSSKCMARLYGKSKKEFIWKVIDVAASLTDCSIILKEQPWYNLSAIKSGSWSLCSPALYYLTCSLCNNAVLPQTLRILQQSLAVLEKEGQLLGVYYFGNTDMIRLEDNLIFMQLFLLSNRLFLKLFELKMLSPGKVLRTLS